MPRRFLTPLLMSILALAGAAIISATASSRISIARHTAPEGRTQAGAPAPIPGVPGTRGLSLIAEPAAGATPFLNLIAGARHAIALTMYELSDPRIEAALIAAAHRGVDVRVLLNGGYYSEPESTNAPAARDLADHGVHVRLSPTYFALTHQKTLTVDGRESVVMSLNFDGRYASTRDFAILDTQPTDVRAILATFDADWVGRRLTPSAGSGDLVWSPGAQGTVLDLIDAARHTIELESEEMADRPAVAALCAAARRGVEVEVVMTDASEWHRAFATLAGCGVEIRLFHGQAYYIHAKLLEVDGEVALVGSQNLSPTSLDRDRELGVEVAAPAVLRSLDGDFAADFAGTRPWSAPAD